RSIADTNEKKAKFFNKITELKGKYVNIALIPIRTQSKVEDIMISNMEVGKINKETNGNKVDLIIHSDDSDYAVLKKADELHIETMPLSKFNQMILGYGRREDFIQQTGQIV